MDLRIKRRSIVIGTVFGVVVVYFCMSAYVLMVVSRFSR